MGVAAVMGGVMLVPHGSAEMMVGVMLCLAATTVVLDGAAVVVRSWATTVVTPTLFLGLLPQLAQGIV